MKRAMLAVKASVKVDYATLLLMNITPSRAGLACSSARRELPVPGVASWFSSVTQLCKRTVIVS